MGSDLGAQQFYDVQWKLKVIFHEFCKAVSRISKKIKCAWILCRFVSWFNSMHLNCLVTFYQQEHKLVLVLVLLPLYIYKDRLIADLRHEVPL